MAQSSGGGIIKWGLIALAGWWVYENYFAQPAVAATPASGGGAAPPATSPTNPSGIVGANTLAGVYAKMQAAAPPSDM